MNYNYTLGIQNPSVQEKIKAEQFKLSEKILDFRFEFGLDIEEMAKITNCTVNEYMKLEFCDISVPIEEYYNAIEKLKINKTQLIKSVDLIEQEITEHGAKINLRSNYFHEYFTTVKFGSNKNRYSTSRSSINQVTEAA